MARAAGKPVLLYWGADWCPPCSRLKATVFRHPEFVDRTRLFVAVNLDGDEPGAQRLGEQFDVSGYPTVVVLSPDREEITRISIFMGIEQYVHALDVALAATQPASAAYAAVLSGVATDSDLRLLAYYSWGQDNEPAGRRATVAGYVEGPRSGVPTSLGHREIAYLHGRTLPLRHIRVPETTRFQH